MEKPNKELKEMTLEELWELFPIILIPHQPIWKEWAEKEIGNLSILLSSILNGECKSPVINHIGSTAIPGIYAKPIIDILVEIDSIIDKSNIISLMEDNGYICMSVSSTRLSFNKGYTSEGYGEKVFHIHFHNYGDNDEIYFRDYLLANPSVAKDYESFKLNLLPRFRNDRDGYTSAKSPFIEKILRNKRTM